MLFPDRERIRFFRLSAQRKDNIHLQFCFTNVCLPIFSVLSFPLMKYSPEIFSPNFSPFLRVQSFFNRFFYLLMMIFSKMSVRRVLVRYKLRIRVRIRGKTQNRLRRVLVLIQEEIFFISVKKCHLALRRVLVFDTSERIKNVIFFVHERSVCLSIQVELIFA